MEHIKQNDPRLNEKIQKIGCFFISCANVAQMKAQKKLSPEQIEEVWKWSKEEKLIDSQDNITDSASIINRFLRVLDFQGHFAEVGIFKDGKTSFYPSVQNKHRHIDALIQKIKQGGKSKTHFRVVNNAGELLEDPHEPPIKALDIYYSILYAFIP